MILYFDTFITDIPLNNNFKKLKKIENSLKLNSASYKKQSRLDIVKYTLASYSKLKWSNVIIKYELDDYNLIQEFDEYILKLFPNANIFHQRSDNQKKYIESIKFLESLGDEWIFYAPNNDHVFINNDLDIFDKLLLKANLFKSKYNNNVSIIYSHFPETICSIKKGHLINKAYNTNAIIIDEDEDCFVSYQYKGNLDSIQIIHIDLMKNWFLTTDCGDRKIIRAESLSEIINPPNQLVIVPKNEICRHYDGYMHTIYGGSLVYIKPEDVPPLFIPEGFFSNNIKISYGYDEYRDGWVNINPLKSQYSFYDNKYGTDLKITIDKIPIFWYDRISEIDYNDEMNHEILINSYAENLIILSDPWSRIDRYKIKFFILFKWVRTFKYLVIKYFNIFRSRYTKFNNL